MISASDGTSSLSFHFSDFSSAEERALDVDGDVSDNDAEVVVTATMAALRSSTTGICCHRMLSLPEKASYVVSFHFNMQSFQNWIARIEKHNHSPKQRGAKENTNRKWTQPKH